MKMAVFSRGKSYCLERLGIFLDKLSCFTAALYFTEKGRILLVYFMLLHIRGSVSKGRVSYITWPVLLSCVVFDDHTVV